VIEPIGLCRLLSLTLGGQLPGSGRVLETIQETSALGVVTRVACQLGIGTESLRCRVVKAEIDGGGRA
jgi:hypothetical protein